MRRVLIVAFLLLAVRAHAAVTDIQVTGRAAIPGYAYERVTARVTYTVDPNDPHNRGVVDLDKAPRNDQGRVVFHGDLVIVRPLSGGNGVVLLDVVNRGRVTAFGLSGVRGQRDDVVGDGFLLKRGFTIVSVGWEFDVPRTPGVVTLDAPIATEAGRAITGVVRASLTPDRPGNDVVVRDLALYPAIDDGGAEAELTVRDLPQDAGTPIPRAQWRIAGNVISLTGGFTPGKIYDVAYRAANPPVSGVGFLALRDAAAWVKHDDRAPVHGTTVIGFGMSQSGRLLRDFTYQGFNTDEQGRQAFDGMMIQIAGAGRTDLNQRWATTVSLGTHTGTSFPFADSAQRDPVTGGTDGELDNPRARVNQPKVFYMNTAVEYWGGGRAAALVHAAPDGMRDITLPANVRFYFIAGAQHGPAEFPPAAPTNVQLRQNPTDYWWVLRSLLVSMDRWLREGIDPPASAYPTLREGTLIAAAKVAFPTIPGVHSPTALWGGHRMPNPLAPGNGAAGTALPFLVPQVDADGNERAGVRLPEVQVPLATYTGWNFRNAASGGTDTIRPLTGSYIPFARTRADRITSRGPRRAIAERYPTQDAYMAKIHAASAALVKNRYILADDVPAIEARALQHWQTATATPPTSTR